MQIPDFLRGRSEDPAVWAAVFEALSPVTAHGPLGVTLVSVDAESLVLEMPITDGARQPYGLLHGGVSALLAESAASFHACWGQDLSTVAPVGIEINVSHLRSAGAGRVQARARVLRRTRHTVVHEVEIVHVEGGDLLAVARVTNLLRPVPGSGGDHSTR